MNNKGILETIKYSDENDLFSYLVVIVATTYTFTRVIPLEIRHISGILLGVFLVKMIIDHKSGDINNFNNEFETKLREINKDLDYNTKLLYIDADLINLLHNIIEYKKFNKKVYTDLLKSIDNFLIVKENISKVSENPNEYISNMEDYYRDSLNNMQSFVYSIPSDPYLDNKMKRSIQRLQLLLKRHTDEVYRGLGLTTRFVPNGKNIYSDPLFEIY